MATHVVSRQAESRAVAEFLAGVPSGPTALVIEGEAGIGKTTVWLAAHEKATAMGYRVLATRAAQAESVLAYTSLASLLDGVDDSAFAELPPPQRLAIDRVLLRATDDGPITDQRAVTAAFLSVIDALAEQGPIVLAIDDLQWLDQPSKVILTSTMRRFSGPIGVLATVRDEPGQVDVGTWLELRRPDRLSRVRVHPLSLGALHTILTERLGRSLPRPKMRRIQEFSGGNPFYALELGRAMEEETWRDGTALPSSLAELVRARLGGLTPAGREALLAASCLAEPTVDLIARATDTDAQTILGALEEAENKGIVEVDGHRVRFTHPLLNRGVYTDAPPARRRSTHRRFAEIIDEPEIKARHLALAAASGDEITLNALDTAANMARIRGAPAAAAELLDLAMGLGGTTPERSIFSAACHFDAGDPARARALLDTAISGLGHGLLRAQALGLLATVRLYDDSFLEAADILEQGIAEADGDPAARVQMTVMLAYACFNGGQNTRATDTVEDAVARAADLDRPDLLSQALCMRLMIRFLLGNGLDEADVNRILELDDDPADIPIAVRPRVMLALLRVWTDRLDEATEELTAITAQCVERGAEAELIFLGFHRCLAEVWRGNLPEAQRLADEAMERALQLGGDLPMFIALTLKGAVDAYAGRTDEVREDIARALVAGERSSSHRLAEWSVAVLVFLEVSLGNYEDALKAAAPLLKGLQDVPEATEIVTSAFIPDAVEAMVALNRLDDAEEVVDLLEDNGRRLDRPWMLAIGGRCRAMVLAAKGELGAASEAADRAVREHERLHMPFELARTQLLVGQLQRRHRQREAASVTLRRALTTFEALGTPLWAQRTRTELSRASGARTQAELTASEQRVAELAASGMSNRDMAAALFISTKTVEANLSRVYRKLNIRSRAELGRLMGKPD